MSGACSPGKGAAYDADAHMKGQAFEKGTGKAVQIDFGTHKFQGKGAPWRRLGEGVQTQFESEDWQDGLYSKDGEWFPKSAWEKYWTSDVNYAAWVSQQAKSARELAAVCKDVSELQETLLKIRHAWKRVGQGDWKKSLEI